jgi:hypothetical protein
VALERQHDARAGAFLAIATLAKIFPGVLGVILLVQRRWRAVGYTCVAAAAVCALSVAVLGTRVWHDFVFYHLPRLQSGEALRFMTASAREVESNRAPFGIPFKLAALGYTGWGWAQARRIQSVYTALLLALTAYAGWRPAGPQHRLTVWLAILMLASLRSPFAPIYVVATVIVLFLVLTAEVRSRRQLAYFLCALAMFSIPTPGTDPKTLIAVSLVQMVLQFALLLWAALRREHDVVGRG